MKYGKFKSFGVFACACECVVVAAFNPVKIPDCVLFANGISA
jgi:hypothetical protein